jgi:hypothetical protein
MGPSRPEHCHAQTESSSNKPAPFPLHAQITTATKTTEPRGCGIVLHRSRHRSLLIFLPPSPPPYPARDETHQRHLLKPGHPLHSKYFERPAFFGLPNSELRAAKITLEVQPLRQTLGCHTACPVPPDLGSFYWWTSLLAACESGTGTSNSDRRKASASGLSVTGPLNPIQIAASRQAIESFLSCSLNAAALPTPRPATVAYTLTPWPRSEGRGGIVTTTEGFSWCGMHSTVREGQ